MRNNGPKQIRTTTLKLMIEQSREELIPLFQLTGQEISQLRSPAVRRCLNANEYPKHPRNVPAYSPIDNFIYFPQKDPGYPHNIFDRVAVRHEVGHYIHYQINQSIVEEKRKFLSGGKLSEGVKDLSEIIAEYGNIILGSRDYTEYQCAYVFKKALRVFHLYGPLFLPTLSRMTLQESKAEGIL